MNRDPEEDDIDALLKELENTPDEATGADPAALSDDEPAAEPAAAPAEPEPAPIAAEQPAQPPAGTKVDKEQRWVPYDAMFAEREARKEVERILQQRQADDARRDGEVAALKEMLQAELSRREDAKKAADVEAARPKKHDLVQVPDWNDDPAGHVKALNENHRREQLNLRMEIQEQLAERAKAEEALNQTVKSTVDQYQTRTREQEDKANLYSAVGRQEQIFASSAPDYYDAIGAYKNLRVGDYQALGLDIASAQQAVQNEMETQARQFIGARMDPAQAWYALAQRRGVSAPPAPAGAMAAPTPNGNGHAAPVAPQRQPGPRVSTMQRGMASSDGLAHVAQGGGSVPPSKEATLDKLLDLPESEIAAHMDKINKIARDLMR